MHPLETPGGTKLAELLACAPLLPSRPPETTEDAAGQSLDGMPPTAGDLQRRDA